VVKLPFDRLNAPLDVGEDDTEDDDPVHVVEASTEIAVPERGTVALPTWGDWADDLLPGYQSRELRLDGVPLLAEEGEGYLSATLVRRNHPPRHARAVLYIHGWNDYFFQTHLADEWDALGYDFYAIDLRRYGRSMHPGELPGYIDDLADYDLELDAAIERIRRHHRRVVINAHSTGGLIAALWASRHPGVISGLVLNSPWIELQGSAMMRAIAAPLVKTLATRRATWAIPMSDSSSYFRTLHASADGEWDYDVELKRNPSNPVRPGWLSAILRGQERVAAGLGIDVPVLMMISARSDFRRSWDEDLRKADIVLDVDRLAARAPHLGWHVTLVRIEDAVHDIVLSPVRVRAQFFDQLRRWEHAYLSW
jgi:alpha-beta hydrolase superfamily lysophospholipase